MEYTAEQHRAVYGYIGRIRNYWKRGYALAYADACFLNRETRWSPEAPGTMARQAVQLRVEAILGNQPVR